MGCTRNLVSMQGLGYKEILDYLNGECTLEDVKSFYKVCSLKIKWLKHK